jgi:hypothetical protein
MNSQRFFQKSRAIFGSPLLSMNPNTIRSLCVSSRFHFSIKQQNLKKLLNDNQIITTVSDSMVNKFSNNLQTKNEEDIDELMEEIRNIIGNEICTITQISKWSDGLNKSIINEPTRI